MPSWAARWIRPVGAIVLVGLALLVDLITWAGQREVRGGPMLPLLIVPLLTAAVYPVLLLRWRRPIAVFGVLWAYALISLVVPQFQPFAGLLLALHAVASRTAARSSAVALASLSGPFALYSYNSAGSVGADFVQLLVLWLLLGAGAWGVGRLSYGATQRAVRLSQLQATEAAEAVRAERIRLARDLHDIVSHAVTTMLIQAAAAKTMVSPASDPRVSNSLDVIQRSGVQAMAELHRMLMVLREEDAADGPSATAAPPPTLADVASLIDLSRTAGQSVQMVGEGRPVPLDPSVAAAAYRVVQEALTNSLKHAGPDAPVTVRVQWEEDWLRLAVTNARSVDGGGQRLVVPSSGHGLDGLHERVRLVGGSLTTRAADDTFAVHVQLPLSRMPELVAGSQPSLERSA